MKASKESNTSDEDDNVIVQEEIEFSDFLQKHVGDSGIHQWVAMLAVCLADMVDCMLILAPVFVAAIPEHTCNAAKYSTTFNCTDDESKDIFIPKEERHGKVVPSQCQYYSDIPVHNQTLNECSHLNFTGLSAADCDQWVYDSTFYTSTIVTEVRLPWQQIL